MSYSEQLSIIDDEITSLQSKEQTSLANELRWLKDELVNSVVAKDQKRLEKAIQNIDAFFQTYKADLVGKRQQELTTLQNTVTWWSSPESSKPQVNSNHLVMWVGIVLAVSALFAYFKSFWKKSPAAPTQTPPPPPVPPAPAETPTPDAPTESVENLADTERSLPVRRWLGFQKTGDFGEDRGDHKHKWIDLANGKDGDPIYPVRPWVVEKIGYQEYGSGNSITINHGNGKKSKYFHLKQRSPLPVGTVVDRDTVIWNIGNTWHSSNPHLHLEIRQNGAPVNPADCCNFDNIA